MGKDHFFKKEIASPVDFGFNRKVQIRHNALEACRQFINKKLDKELAGQYFLRLFRFRIIFRERTKCLLGLGQIECRLECS